MPNCSQDHFDDVWAVFDRSSAKTATLRVPRAALEDMIQCAAENAPERDKIGQGNAADVIRDRLLSAQPRSNSTTLEVHRQALWEFLHHHDT